MDPFIGEIRLFAGNYAPKSWRFCNGDLLSISEYQYLFSLIGATYGGDGRTNFALPDLRGRIPLASGQAPGLSNRILCSKGGAESVTLTNEQLPAHTHGIKVSKSVGSSVTNPTNLTYLGPVVVQSPNTGYGFVNGFTSGTKRTLDDSVIHPFPGNGQPHNNVMPSIVLSYIICVVNGIYPTPG